MMGMTAVRMLALAALAATGACSEPVQLRVEHGWVRLPAVAGRPAAGYFTLHGGAVPATLIDVSSEVSVRSEMHESMAQGQMTDGDRPGGAVTTMKPIARVAVPAHATITFAPGGRHVMLFDLNPGIKPGSRRAPLTLSFADGTRLVADTVVVGAGDPPPEW